MTPVERRQTDDRPQFLVSAVFSAVELNYYGNCEPRYALELAKRFIRRNNRIIGCGITPIPSLGSSPLIRQQEEFFQRIERQRQAPGP